MAKNNKVDLDQEVDPWWAKFWYTSVVALSIWMIGAIYGALNFDLELNDASVIVREDAEGRGVGKQICRIELWLVVIVVPLSLAIVNTIMAVITRSKVQSD